MKKKKKQNVTSTYGAKPSSISVPAEASFNFAVSLFQNKNLADAKKLLKELLSINPKHAESWFLFALIADEELLPQDAINYLEIALKIDPNNLKYIYTLGDIYYANEYLIEGVKLFESIIIASPNDHNAYYNLAAFQQKQKQYDKSLENYHKVLELDENNINAIYNIGNILIDIKDYLNAAEYFKRVIKFQPNSDDAMNNLGFLNMELGDYEQAIIYLNNAISINSDNFSALNNLGKVCEKKFLYLEALEYFDAVIRLKPDFSETYSNRGVILHGIKQFTAALIDFDKAINLNPNMAEVYSNRGNTLKEIMCFDEALASFDRAIEIKPDFAEAYSNRGVLFDWLLHHEEAIINFDRAIAVQPYFADAYWNKALSILRLGNLYSGWELYEWRWKVARLGLIKRSFPQPLLLGNENIQNKTILLHAEQGLGDTIQFCRYAKLVKESGARVLLEAPKPLLSLLSELEGVDQLIESGNKLPDFDYHCPLMSLPLVFKTELANIPSRTPYLAASKNKQEKWTQKLGVNSKLLVGLVWSGSTAHKNDHNRSLMLQQLLPYLSDLCEYVSLQKEVREIDKQVLDGSNIKQYGDELNDFSDTAALCELMDLVISVDTSVAHLAGAIGKTTWILLPHVPDWRWLLDREDSPWYPSIKIYRQPSHGDWDSVIQSVRQDLIEYSNNWKLR